MDVQAEGRKWLAHTRDRVAAAAVLLDVLGRMDTHPPETMSLGCNEPVACWHGGRVRVRVRKHGIEARCSVMTTLYAHDQVEQAACTLRGALELGV